MFVRYSITASRKEVAKRFSVDVPESYTPHFNCAPTHLLPIITQDSQQGVSFFYWGTTPSFANQKTLAEKIINTQAEQIAEKAVLRKKMRDKRCLIPADGFYVWKRTGKKTSIPYRFTRRDKDLFLMAGLWEEYDDQHGETFHTFSIITTEANEFVSPFQDRMPVILNPELEKAWLNSVDDNALLPFKGALDFYSVSPRVNSPDKDDKFVIAPAPPSDQFGNLSLFD